MIKKLLLLAVGGYIAWKYFLKDNAKVQDAINRAKENINIDTNTDTNGNTNNSKDILNEETELTPVNPNKFKVLSAIPRKGMADTTILKIEKNKVVKVKDKVLVETNVYNGEFSIWYIYDSEPNNTNIYIKTPYVNNATGVVTVLK